MDKNIILRQPQKTRETNPQEDTFGPLVIPPEAYKEFRRCPHCQSVFIDDNKCEACGKIINFKPIGEALGPKSVYGLKEKYVENLPLITRFISSMENKQSPLAVNYKRHLNKRFILLLEAFNEGSFIDSKKDRKLFYNELKDLISEELEMGVGVLAIEALIEKKLGSEHPLLNQELLLHLHQEARLIPNKGLFLGLKKTFILKTLLTLSVLSFLVFLTINSLVS